MLAVHVLIAFPAVEREPLEDEYSQPPPIPPLELGTALFRGPPELRGIGKSRYGFAVAATTAAPRTRTPPAPAESVRRPTTTAQDERPAAAELPAVLLALAGTSIF